MGVLGHYREVSTGLWWTRILCVSTIYASALIELTVRYSNLPAMYADFAVQCSWEGDNTILSLQAGRALVGAWGGKSILLTSRRTR